MNNHGPAVQNDQTLVSKFTGLFNEFSPDQLIFDLQTEVGEIEIEGHFFPYTLNDGTEKTNSYLCSPTRAYIDYALDETRNFEAHPLLKKGIVALVSACAPLVRSTGLDTQVQLNNWIFSTNPMPEISDNEAVSIKDQLSKSFPDKAILIRSLNDTADPNTISAFSRAGFIMLPSRQVYIVDEAAEPTKEMKADFSKLRRTHFQYVGNDDFQPDDYLRCETLYNMLYLEKYTPLNPHYSAFYIEQMHKRKIMSLAGLRDENGVLVGVTGFFANGRTLTQPIVGYDTSLPHTEALYRMIMAIGQKYAFENGLFFNMSAGAADFKRRRAAFPTIEYSAVYVDHLSLGKRLTTRLIASVLRHIGIPLLKKYEL